MESIVAHDCIICGQDQGLQMLAHTEEIPYFGEHTQVTLSCKACGWCQTDFIPSEGREPICLSFRVCSEQDLTVRVVRGASATVRLVKADLEARPGSHSTGYVSNIEGVLNRFQEVLDMLRRQAIIESTDDETEAEAKQVLCALDDLDAHLGTLRTGEGEDTLELLDPAGHSVILSDSTISRPLSGDEIEDLPIGPAANILEMSAEEARSTDTSE